MDIFEIALQLTLKVIEVEDYRLFGTDADRSPKKVGTAAAELFNQILVSLNTQEREE